MKKYIVNTNSKRFILLPLFFLCMLVSCKDNREDVKDTLAKIIGREVKYPSSLKINSERNNYNFKALFNRDYKIVAYFDTSGCTECKMKLNNWQDLIKETIDSGINLSFQFIIAPQRGGVYEVKSILKRYRFNYPFLIDSLNEFGRVNQLPQDSRYHTFLLNKQNKIVLVGSPIDNERMWSLYKAYINGSISTKETGNINKADYSSSKDKETTIEVDRDSVNLGRINRINKSTIFRLKNVGSLPLSIQAVKTSCGCTAAKYDKKPIPPGRITTVTLEYKPNSLGYFHKTADVVCNIPEGFVRLSISGIVVEN